MGRGARREGVTGLGYHLGRGRHHPARYRSVGDCPRGIEHPGQAPGTRMSLWPARARSANGPTTLGSRPPARPTTPRTSAVLGRSAPGTRNLRPCRRPVSGPVTRSYVVVRSPSSGRGLMHHSMSRRLVVCTVVGLMAMAVACSSDSSGPSLQLGQLARVRGDAQRVRRATHERQRRGSDIEQQRSCRSVDRVERSRELYPSRPCTPGPTPWHTAATALAHFFAPRSHSSEEARSSLASRTSRPRPRQT